MSSVNKIYYDVNFTSQSIVRVASKPKEFSAEETISKIYQLTQRVVNRPSDSLLVGKEKELTPGYTLLYIRGELSDDPIPALNVRVAYNLSTRARTINFIVNTIIDQYQKTYERDACCLRKWLDCFLIWIGVGTTFSRMQQMQTAIRSDMITAQQQASNYVDWVYREPRGIASLSSCDGPFRDAIGNWAQRESDKLLGKRFIF
jgi:hypothetical protein